MGFVKEFKEFAMKGNVVDLAVGVVIGAAFGKIVTALVSDIVMPPITYVTSKGGGDWRTVTVGPNIKLGDFAGTVLDFLIVAFAIFLVVKGINTFKKEEAAAPAPAEPTSTDKLLAEIRDELRKR
jgi:large conductance mechanosensitive channel